MRLALVVLTAWAGLLPSRVALANAAGVPLCRLAKNVPPIVQTTADEALRYVARAHNLPLDRVALNPPQSRKKALSFFIVVDAQDDEVDVHGCAVLPRASKTPGALDALSVRGVCRAYGQEVYCSESAVLTMLGDDSAGVSPFLFFTIAHELTHIALQHPGTLSHGFSIDLTSPAAAKTSNLVSACITDDEQLARETAADQGALDALTAAFGEAPFVGPAEDRVLAIIRNAESVYQAFRRVMAWAATFYGSSSELVAAGRYTACDVMRRASGRVVLPVLGGDHPHLRRRMGTLMMWVAHAVVELEVPFDAPPEVRGAIRTLNSNAITDGFLGFSQDIVTARFCRDVRALAANELSCERAPSGSAVVDIHEDELAAMLPRPPSLHFEVPTRAVRAHRDVSSGADALLLQVAPLLLDHPTKQAAIATAENLVVMIHAFMDGLETRLSETQGFIVHERGDTIEVRFNPFNGAWGAAGDFLVLARVPHDFDVRTIPGYTELAARRAIRQLKQPWAERRYEAVLQFYSDPRDTHQDSKRLLTRRLGLDFYFDTEAARAGKTNMPGKQFVELMCYARDRLKQRYGAPFTLDKVDEDEIPFYLIANDTSTHNWYLPREWAPIASTSCAKADTARADQASRLSRLYDYGNQSQELPAAEFATIFGDAP